MKTLFLLLFAMISFAFSKAQSNSFPPPPPPPPSNSANLKVYTFVEQNPQFPGGDGELMKFLQRNIKYPKRARRLRIEGKVLLRFIVDETGAVTDVMVARSVDKDLDAEAVRVVKLLPNFTPGHQQGKPVRVYFNLPIVFRLQ
jgi:TonB family protein